MESDYLALNPGFNVYKLAAGSWIYIFLPNFSFIGKKFGLEDYSPHRVGDIKIIS